MDAIKTEPDEEEKPSCSYIMAALEIKIEEGSSLEEEMKILKAEEKSSHLYRKMRALQKELEITKAEHATASSILSNLKAEKAFRNSKEKIAAQTMKLESDWIAREFDWSDNVKKVLKEKFKFDSFRPKQLAAINGTLAKKDVLLVMPTGGGKSLVYQLPTFLESGITLVISPLISLIEDQLMACRRFGILAQTIHSNIAKEQVKHIFDMMMDKTFCLKMVFMTPEWLAKSKRFLSHLKKCYENGRIARVAIDEVHCCSTWGHDFRPDYKFLGILRNALANVPFIGLTATATVNVLTDIQTMLNLENSLIITAPFNRPNLFYKVIVKPVAKELALQVLQKLIVEKYKEGTGIIYTNTVTETVSLAHELRGIGLSVAPYHAQLEPSTKTDIFQKWVAQKYQIIIATIAFGMGIDKANVRFVIHYNLPKSMESLYQESGRAGRDGAQADCVIFFNFNDYLKVLGRASSLADEAKAKSVLEYCIEQKICRRSLLAAHFEESWDASHCHAMCDNCLADLNELSLYNLTSAAKDIHCIMEKAEEDQEHLTLIKLLEKWFQTCAKKNRNPKLTKPKIAKEHGECILAFLLLCKYIRVEKGYSSYNTLCYLVQGKKVKDDEIFMLTRNKLMGFPKKHGSSPPGNSPEPPPKKIKKMKSKKK